VLTPEQQAQLQQGGRGKGGMEKLNLTADQKAKMEQLRAASRTQMEAILTPAQQQQAKAWKEQREAMGGKWQSLNLTADQKAKMKAIRQASEAQFKTILTPEQQTKLKAGHRGRGHRQA
jgi:periplasmic protein CpxP/Spy